MSVTYTTAAERDAFRARQSITIALPDALLLATSLVAVLAIALAAIGRLRSFDEAARVGAPIVNLNTVRDTASLEPALANVFSKAQDRRFAAAELFRFLSNDAGERRAVPNVGALSRITVSASAIRATRNLEALPARLTKGADRVPLFTAADIAALKPAVIVRTRDEFKNLVWLFGGLYVLSFQAVAMIWRRRGRRVDPLLLSAAHLLTAIGFALLLSRPDPLRDTQLFVRYSETIMLGLAAMTALSFVNVPALGFASFSYLPLIGALSLSVLLILFGSGPGTSAAKVNLGPLQPIEAIRLLLALFLAGYFGRRWELLRETRGETIRDVRLPHWINIPRAEYALPVIVGVAAALMFFFFQKDLGPALFLCCVFLAVYAVARGRVGMAATGLVLLVAGFYAGYRLQISSTLVSRVRMWQSPWDNGVAGGDQITHSLWAMATGGTFGTGLGLGDTRYLPAGHTDLILAAIGEELGVAGLIAVAVLFAILAWRGFRIGRQASSDYGFFLAVSLTLFLVLPALIMAAGVMGVTPLTGVVTPFLSYGGSAMIMNFAALGVLAAVHADVRPAVDFEPFRVPMRNLSGALAVCAIVLIGVAGYVQVVRADELVVMPHLGLHADGGRRFAYNPRVLDLIRNSPRGTIFDRRGLPLASDDRRVLADAQQQFQRLGISIAAACPESSDLRRCYPLGGTTVHVLGDARTTTNWSATNTSYVERDADTQLRGFDDHASTVKTLDRSGSPMYTVHRDYRDLVPVLRHRHQPEHPAIVAFRDRPRDVRLTLDADLQRRLAAIVANYARKAQGKAAAVVLDPDTGAVLATVSYPWPALSPAEGLALSSAEGPALSPAEGPALSSAEGPTMTAMEGSDGTPIESSKDDDVWLDRARYGAYPPGSTFKLVVAMAAMRDGVTNGTYTCLRLPDGRIGARINGWTRPVRDDVLDTHPHGTIDMHDGLVHSCNAYFAQLAVTLGPAPLMAVANQLKIPLTPDGSSLQRVRDTLPQVGFGQAQVVASPLRMATVAGVVAAGGLLRSPYVEQDDKDVAKVEPVVDANSARRLGSYMRDVVLNGTGRSLKNHQIAIAGKTGTAEVSARDSHSWFVGYAPYGAAKRRIAFAIVIEHAGYGGITAAPAAGEIVSAAVAAGVIGSPASAEK